MISWGNASFKIFVQEAYGGGILSLGGSETNQPILF